MLKRVPIRATLPAWGLLLAMACGPATAKVSAEQAARLDGELTPVGAERSGNADGSIPEWRGGWTQPPPCFKGAGSRYCDPFVADEPLYTVTAENLEQYRALLTPGQQALFAQYPQSYRMRVFPTRRSFANPAFVYAATRKNAVQAELGANGEALIGALTGVPFPLPSNGQEIIWNHKLRYREPSTLRWNNQFAVTKAGDFTRNRIREESFFAYGQSGVTAEALDNIWSYWLQLITQPERLEGTILLVHEPLDPLQQARAIWQRSPGQSRLRRAPNVGYDTPGIGADGLRTADQDDGFSGPTDRYDWKLLGKRELLVPANSYALHDDALRYGAIVRKGHINAELPRYELRRVWVVEAALRKNSSHQYRRRAFYLDEDGWQIRVVDLYDARGELWRVQELHSVVAYDQAYELPVCETVYDLQSNRYLVQALNNEDPETAATSFEPGYFKPGNVSKLAKR
jgi:hypothetical protein